MGIAYSSMEVMYAKDPLVLRTERSARFTLLPMPRGLPAYASNGCRSHSFSNITRTLRCVNCRPRRDQVLSVWDNLCKMQ